MANNKSALKRIRQDEKRETRNRAARSRMRTAVKKLRSAVADGDAETARGLLGETIAVVDTTAQKGVIHRNKAARTNARLSRAVNQLEA